MIIFGHRGAPGFPRQGENTIESFRKALREGAHALELDVRRCGDSSIVVIHDETIERTTGVRGSVREFSCDELRALNIPCLSDILDEFSEKCLINIELKDRRIATDVLRMVRNRNVLISAFEWDELSAFVPRIPIALLITQSDLSRIGLQPFIDEAIRRKASAVHPERTADVRALLPLARAASLGLHVWTVNDPDEIAYFRGLGVDGIFTDFPARGVPG